MRPNDQITDCRRKRALPANEAPEKPTGTKLERLAAVRWIAWFDNLFGKTHDKVAVLIRAIQPTPLRVAAPLSHMPCGYSIIISKPPQLVMLTANTPPRVSLGANQAFIKSGFENVKITTVKRSRC